MSLGATPPPAELHASEDAAAGVSASPAPLSSITLADADPDPTSVVHLSDLECALCCCLLLDPVTTDGCGHSFCRECLARSLAIKRFCPLCRHPCNMDALAHPTAQLLATLAQRFFPREYAARKAEALAEGQLFERRAARAPRYGLFLSSSPHFPLAPLQLHIFEPRYRVMISRAMAAPGRNFVLVCVPEHRPPEAEAPVDPAVPAVGGAAAAPAPEANALPLPAGAPRPMGAPHVMDPLRFHPGPFDPLRAGALGDDPSRLPRAGDIATLVHIRNVRALPDGRSFVDCVGTKRVRLLDVRMEDEESFGLLSAEADVVEDEPEQEQQQQQAGQDAPQEQLHPPEVHDGEAKEDVEAREQEGLRNRWPAPAASSASASSSSSSSIVAAAPSPAAASAFDPVPAAAPSPVPLSELVAQCRNLLAHYCHLSGLSLERLALMHGSACPSTEGDSPEQLAAFAWWILRVLPEGLAIKQEALASRSLRERLHLCVALLHESIALTQERTRNQSRFVAVLAILALIMFAWKAWGR